MEGFEIPIGADFSAFTTAMNTMAAEMASMGASISASMNRSNAAISQAVAALGKMHGGTNAASVSAGNLTQKFMKATTTAGSLGQAAAGVVNGLQALNTVTQTLHGINLAARIGGWVQSLGGLRAALASIPRTMRAIAGNRTFQMMAAGAVLAVGSIYTIRTAFRTVTGSVHLLGSAANSMFHGMVSAAKSSARAVSGAFKGVSGAMGSMMPGGLPIAGLVSAAGSIGIAMSSIGKAADMETLQTAFAPLLGGAKAAQERIGELATFAANTPFELPEIATASRTLQTLTKGALATGAGLTMVGDVAAGVNAPFDEIAVTIGRMYDGLQSGRPVGEAMQRLQDLGVISGDVRSKIEDLQESGAKGPAVWSLAAGALGAFSGSMERQANTWNGKLSTLSDGVSMLMAEFGKPIIDGLKPFLDMAISKVDSLKSAGVAMGNAIRTAFDGAMAAWQTGTMTALIGDGLSLAMIDGVNALAAGVLPVLGFIGKSIGMIFSTIGKSMEDSGITGVFISLAQLFGSVVTAALLSAMGKITGWQGWENDAADERKRTGGYVSLVKTNMEGLDLGKGMKTLEAGIADLWKGAKAETQKQGANPFLDRTEAAGRYQSTADIVKAQMDKNREAIEKNGAALDAKLNKFNPTPGGNEGPPEKINKVVSGYTMSLTRIGGGGFANTVMSALVPEAKKQTGYLKKIAEKIGGPPPTATAVYT